MTGFVLFIPAFMIWLEVESIAKELKWIRQELQKMNGWTPK